MDGEKKIFGWVEGEFLKRFPEGGGKRMCVFWRVVGFLVNNFYVQGLYLWLPASRRNRSFPAICQAHIKTVLNSRTPFLCGHVSCTA